MARSFAEANAVHRGLRRDRWAFRAVEVEDERRERVWETALRTYPGFSAYARRAAPRPISVFLLEPKV